MQDNMTATKADTGAPTVHAPDTGGSSIFDLGLMTICGHCADCKEWDGEAPEPSCYAAYSFDFATRNSGSSRFVVKGGLSQ